MTSRSAIDMTARGRDERPQANASEDIFIFATAAAQPSCVISPARFLIAFAGLVWTVGVQNAWGAGR